MTGGPEMSNAEQVGELLLREWTTGLRLTTIPQAMGRLGIKDDLRLRWAVTRRLEGVWRDALTSPEKRRAIAQALGRPFDESQLEGFREQVGTWNLAAVALSEDEKLVARHMLMHQRRGRPLPQPGDTAKTLGLPVRQVRRALRMLARLGFLKLDAGRSPRRFSLSDGHEKLLQGLGFMFHVVSLPTGERFGVP